MLYLLPNVLLEESDVSTLSAQVADAVDQITHLIVENEKQGRQFLRRFVLTPPKTFRDIPLFELNEHSTKEEKRELIEKIQQEGVWGLVSDCGMPCLADPGADLVMLARQKGIAVQAFAGPSSILLALVLSGLGGQKFTFHGYLPREEASLLAELHLLQERSEKEGSTHLFIEAPYRNEKLLKILLDSLADQTFLCIACNLSGKEQYVHTQTVQQWKKGDLPCIQKRPTVFVVKSL